VAMPATHRVLQQQQPLKIFHAESRQTETGRGTLGTSHWIHRFYKRLMRHRSGVRLRESPSLFRQRKLYLAIFLEPSHCEPLYNRSGPCLPLL
jgi:hypothetical protein